VSPGSQEAVELILNEAERLASEGRYAEGLAGAERAVEAARTLGDLPLELRASSLEGRCLGMLGDNRAALVRYTWIIGIADDPAKRSPLAAVDVTWDIATAYMDWVECARFIPELPVAKLFGVIDAGEAWLRSIGRPEWRAALLSNRGDVLRALGKRAEALGHQEEALALKRRNPGGPGYTLETYLWSLGDLLRQLGRADEAEPHYQEILNRPSAPPYDRKVALQGLARCALARGDTGAAVRHATAAVTVAEGMGDYALCAALETLLDAQRAAADRGAAERTSGRYLAVARRVSDYSLYFALRGAADVALDGGDGETAQRHLDEAEPLAQALDRQRGVATFVGEIAARRQRLEGFGRSQ
jgi:tetratricopeptide (TPR) repeat protein